MENSIFEELLAVDVTKHLEKKKAGNKELAYLSWPFAWAEIKKRYPNATFEIWKDEKGLPYAYDENAGYMVYVTLKLDDQEFPCFLPILDSNNHAMKSHPYEIEEYNPLFSVSTLNKEDGKYYDKFGNVQEEYKKVIVPAMTMFDANKTIMRCLVKACAFAGLGLFVFAGEDINDFAPSKEAKKKVEKKKEAPVEKKAVAKDTKNLSDDSPNMNHYDYTMKKILSVKLSVDKVLEYFGNKPFNELTEKELTKIDNMCDKYAKQNQIAV